MADEDIQGAERVTIDEDRRVRMPRYPVAGYIPADYLALIHPGILTVPGETLKKLRVRLQGRTGVVSEDLEPLYRDIWVFWTPFRVVWNGWGDWISSGGTVGDLPETDYPSPWRGEGSTPVQGTPRKILGLPRLCYDAVASLPMWSNSHVLDAEFSAADTAAAAGAYTTTYRQLGAPSILAEVPYIDEGTDEAAQVTLSVVNNEVVLSLDDLRKLHVAEEMQRWDDTHRLSTLTPYEQMLQLYGVKLPDAGGLRESPELLDSSRAIGWPQRFTEPSDGSVTARYNIQADVDLAGGRRFFPEHGLVQVFMGLRRENRPTWKEGLVLHERKDVRTFIPPLVEYEPMLEPRAATDAAAQQRWVWGDADDRVDARDELHRGEHVFIGKSDGGDYELVHEQSNPAANTPAIRKALSVASSGIADIDSSVTGSAAVVTGLVTASIASPVGMPARQSGLA